MKLLNIIESFLGIIFPKEEAVLAIENLSDEDISLIDAANEMDDKKLKAVFHYQI